MIALRIVLFLGLVLHKAVWEIMKRGEHASATVGPTREFNLKTVVKSIKVLFLVFLIIQTLFLDIFPITGNPGTLRVVGLCIYLIGLGVAIFGRVNLGENWANLEDYQVLPEQQLVKRGIYRYIRHPIYTGDILLVIGLEIALNSWLFLLAIPLVAVVVRQTLAEEAVLSHVFPGYDSYRKETKMFIPFVV